MRWHIAIHLENPRLETVLNSLAVDVLEEGEFEAFERRYEAAILHFLERHTSRLRVGDVEIAAFLVMQLLHSALNRALVHRRAALEDGQLEAELTDMILRYLARD